MFGFSWFLTEIGGEKLELPIPANPPSWANYEHDPDLAYTNVQSVIYLYEKVSYQEDNSD